MAQFKGFRNQQTYTMHKIATYIPEVAKMIAKATSTGRLADQMAEFFADRQKAFAGRLVSAEIVDVGERMLIEHLLEASFEKIDWHEVAAKLVRKSA